MTDHLNEKYPSDAVEYDLVVVADPDADSHDAEEGVWKAEMFKGKLYRTSSGDVSYRAEWDHKNPATLESHKSDSKNRGMELSELKWFPLASSSDAEPKPALLAFDDRTGTAYEVDIDAHDVDERFSLRTGDGTKDKGFKGEWATVKDGKLIVGSHGRELTDLKTGEILNYNNMYVKYVDCHGKVEHSSWEPYWNRLRNYVLMEQPDQVEDRNKFDTTRYGYIVNEAIEWSDYHKKWIIVPRRVSKQPFDKEKDSRRGANIMILADEDFESIEVVKVPLEDDSSRGFSSIKIIPNRPNEFLAVKSVEVDDVCCAYATVFTIDGKVLMPETKICNEKIEGIEFV
eukprot:gb/GECH01011103.1/.p1 GENE.gb/GECH01011103.1/~~gb/GECH01011103.1/.p1  ORF type:complete len:343 (+),score=101.28 gb/GECH01011103.1/:1-1029(+)